VLASIKERCRLSRNRQTSTDGEQVYSIKEENRWS
jgi:hypothetical protein